MSLYKFSFLLIFCFLFFQFSHSQNNSTKTPTNSTNSPTNSTSKLPKIRHITHDHFNLPKKGERGCLINQKQCVAHPKFKGFFRDSWGERNLRAGWIEYECFKRAKHFHEWCCNPLNESTSATFMFTGSFRYYPDNNFTNSSSTDNKSPPWNIKLPIGPAGRIAHAYLIANDALKKTIELQKQTQNDTNRAINAYHQIEVDNVAAEAARRLAQLESEEAKSQRRTTDSTLHQIRVLYNNQQAHRRQEQLKDERIQEKTETREMRRKNKFRQYQHKIFKMQQTFKARMNNLLKQYHQRLQENNLKHQHRLQTINDDYKHDFQERVGQDRAWVKTQNDAYKQYIKEIEEEENDILKKIHDMSNDLYNKAKEKQLKIRMRADATRAKTLNTEDEIFNRIANENLEKKKEIIETDQALLKKHEEIGLANNQRTKTTLDHLYRNVLQSTTDRDLFLSSVEKRQQELIQKGMNNLEAFSQAMEEMMKQFSDHFSQMHHDMLQQHHENRIDLSSLTPLTSFP